MKCPYCGEDNDKVIDSRNVNHGITVRRRRICNACQKRFTTFEQVEYPILMVLKHNGTRQMFDINKLANGLIRACDKRDKTMEEIMSLAQRIWQNIREKYHSEVRSQEIGEMALEQLKDFDQVAYIRFASVYKRFSDIESFRKELDVLLAKMKK